MMPPYTHLERHPPLYRAIIVMMDQLADKHGVSVFVIICMAIARMHRDEFAKQEEQHGTMEARS